MLLNVAIFTWFGAVCPWYSFVHNSQIPIYRLIFLGILVLLLRRIPIVVAMQKGIHQIKDRRQLLFVGYFGPIGVSAIFYLYVSLEYLRTSVNVDGHEREDATRLGEIIYIIVWFLVICSIVAHGLTVPLGKLGFYLPRTISRVTSQGAHDPAFHDSESPATGSNSEGSSQSIYVIGRSSIKFPKSQSLPNFKAMSNHGTPKDLHSSSPTCPTTPTVEGIINFPQPVPHKLKEAQREGWSDEQLQKIGNPNSSTQGHLSRLHSLDECTLQNSPTRSRTSTDKTLTALMTPVGLGTRNIKVADEEEGEINKRAQIRY